MPSKSICGKQILKNNCLCKLSWTTRQEKFLSKQRSSLCLYGKSLLEIIWEQAHVCNKQHHWRNMYTITRPRKLEATASFVESDLNRVQLWLAVAAFQKEKIQEITKRADHALISKLAVEASFHYLAQIHTDVRTHNHTQTQIDSNLKVL